MATPATGAWIGTPASIRDRVEPHTEAMEEEPLEDRISLTRRSGIGELFLGGDHRQQRALRQRAVTDLAAARALQTAAPHRWQYGGML